MQNAAGTDEGAALDRTGTGTVKPLIGGPGPGPNAIELDVQRLVWDPEYRNEVRNLLKR